jgi:hypothetical protein
MSAQAIIINSTGQPVGLPHCLKQRGGLMMKFRPKKIKGLIIVICALALSACGPAVGQTPTTDLVATATAIPVTATAIHTATAVATQATTFSDPFAYCASVGDADEPGPSYTGEKMPQTVIDGMRKVDAIGTDIPQDVLVSGSVWRCMGSKVYACFVGANLPCDAKANTDKTPTAAETDFCKANPDSLGIPAAVTGHETIYDWNCKGTVPSSDKVGFHVDARGYISEIWFLISN